MKRTAVMSPCGTYRYWLEREWSIDQPRLVVVMLNPSTADEMRDDPTINKLTSIAKRWSHGGLIVVNLNAFRATDPLDMIAALGRGQDVEGPENEFHVTEALLYALNNRASVLVAWGNGGSLRNADEHLVTMARGLGIALVCLGLTTHGHPKHPLARGKHFIPRDVMPQPFRWEP